MNFRAIGGGDPKDLVNRLGQLPKLRFIFPDFIAGVAQSGSHFVECRRQLTDLVAGSDIDVGFEIPLADFCRAVPKL